MNRAREYRIRRLISKAATTRLCKLSAKGGPLSDMADEAIYERTLWKRDPRAAEGLGLAHYPEDTPHLEHPFMDFVASENRS
jgi:hypothetical protein